MAGVIVPRSQGGDGVVQVVGTPLLRAERNGLGQVAQGLGSLGQDIERIGLDMKLQDDQTRTTAALTKAESDWQKVLFDQQSGLMFRKGENALEGPDRQNVIDSGLARREEILNASLEGLSNDQQKQALRDAWSSRSRFAVSTLQNHQIREQESFQNRTDEASIEIQSQIIVNAESGLERDEAIGAINTTVGEIARRRGWGEEQVESALRKFLSPPLEAMIRLESQSDPANAEKLLEQYEDFIDAGKRPGLLKELATEKRAIESQGMAAAAFASVPDDSSLEDTLDWVRANTSGQAEDDTLTRVESQWRQKELSKSTERNKVSESLAKGIRSRFAKPVKPTAEQNDVERENIRRSAVEANLSESDTSTLIKLHDDLAIGKNVVTNYPLYDALMRNPADVAKLTPAQLQSSLEETELEDVLEAKRDLDAGQIQNHQLVNDEISVALNALGLRESRDREIMGVLRGQMISDLRARQKDGQLTPAIRSEVIGSRTSAHTKRIFGANTVGNDSKDVRDEFAQNPNLVGMALWAASNGGSHQASDLEIASELNRMQARQRQIELTGTPEQLSAFVAEVTANGEEARRRLTRSDYPDQDIIGGKELIAAEEAQARQDSLDKKRAKENAAVQKDIADGLSVNETIRARENRKQFADLPRRAGVSIEELLRIVGDVQ